LVQHGGHWKFLRAGGEGQERWQRSGANEGGVRGQRLKVGNLREVEVPWSLWIEGLGVLRGMPGHLFRGKASEIEKRVESAQRCAVGEGGPKAEGHLGLKKRGTRSTTNSGEDEVGGKCVWFTEFICGRA